MRHLTVIGASALTVATMLAGVSTVALAADLPSRRAPPVYAPPPPIPVFTWTGLYIGGNVGAAFGQDRGPFGTGNSASFVGGAQVGFNYEFGSSTAGLGVLGGLGNAFNSLGGGSLGTGIFGPNSGIVIGGIADAQYLDGHNGAYFTPGGVSNGGINYSSTDYFGTVRGRLGVGINRVLVYGTGGFAYNLRTDGYTVGGGLEYALTNNLTVGAEYLRVEFNRGGVYEDATGGLFNRPGDFNIARAFMNFKFDPFQAVTAPVVARY